MKRAALRALIAAEGEACTNAIVFCNRKMDVDVVAKSLKRHGFNAAPIHGNLDQSQRMKTLDGFRDGSLHVLVASDVAARGLDIPAVSHVFNFDAPSHPEDYVHRIGRTGRAGRKGKAYTIVTPADDKYLGAIESLVKHPIPKGELPEGFSFEERPEAPRREKAEGERRGRGGRDRSGERRGKPVAAETALPEAIEVEADAGVVADVVSPPRREEERRDRPRREDRRDDRRESGERSERHDRGERREDDRRREDRRREWSRDLGPAVVGMGDHVPDFILRSFALPEDKATAEDDLPLATAAQAQPEQASAE